MIRTVNWSGIGRQAIETLPVSDDYSAGGQLDSANTGEPCESPVDGDPAHAEHPGQLLLRSSPGDSIGRILCLQPRGDPSGRRQRDGLRESPSTGHDVARELSEDVL